MAQLTGADVNARQVMLVQAYHLVGRAEDPLSLAESMLELWRSIVREQRGQGVRPLRRTPSSQYFQAATAELVNATAPTTKIDTAELLAQFEEEEKTVP